MNQYGGMGGFGFRQPSQRETISGGYEGGVKIPIIQAFASIVFASLCVLFVWILLFVIGPDVLWCAGFAVIVVVARRVLLWIGTAQQETQEEVNGARAMTLAVCFFSIVLLVAWAASRKFCVGIWPVLPRVDAWRTVFAVTFIIPPIAVCALMALSFAINAYNPSAFQPHQAKPAGTPWWSPTGQALVDTEPDDGEYRQVAQTIREIPRPIPAYSNCNPNPNSSKVQERLTDASERQHATPPEQINDRFVAPGGRTVRVADLNEYVLDGVVVGATFRTWKERKGWEEGYWSAIARSCAQHGIVKNPRPRSRTLLLVHTRHDAVKALEHLWKHVFPPPSPAPQSVGCENDVDVRQTEQNIDDRQN